MSDTSEQSEDSRKTISAKNIPTLIAEDLGFILRHTKPENIRKLY